MPCALRIATLLKMRALQPQVCICFLWATRRRTTLMLCIPLHPLFPASVRSASLACAFDSSWPGADIRPHAMYIVLTVFLSLGFFLSLHSVNLTCAFDSSRPPILMLYIPSDHSFLSLCPSIASRRNGPQRDTSSVYGRVTVKGTLPAIHLLNSGHSFFSAPAVPFCV